MPTFEYVCRECQTPFDMFFKTREEQDIVACPACKSRNIVKKFSAFATSNSSHGASDFGGCESGACGMPSHSPCAGGACGLN